ncbi:hypothetical protein JCM30471_30250 [Desulfuromonas carbonis]|nr:hypothetical protein DBW_0803 [Desulfuromonas sp. DDH964]
MRLKFLFLLVVLGLIAGCAQFEKKDEGFRVVAAEALKYAKLSVDQIGQNNDQSIHQGQVDGLEFFAPATFSRSIYYRDKVRKNIQGNQNRREIIRESELLQKYLKESYDLKDTLTLELKEILQVNQFLKKLNAHVSYPKEFASFQERTADMIQQFEEDRTPAAFKDRGALLGDMQKLEAQVTIEIVLGPAKKVFDDMQERDLDEEAPLSLQKAKDVYAAGEAAIWQNCRDQETLDRAGSGALFWSTRARNLSEETRRLKGLKKDEFESVVLEAESRLHAIGKALGVEDLRNLPLNEQGRALVQKIGTQIATDASAPPK